MFRGCAEKYGGNGLKYGGCLTSVAVETNVGGARARLGWGEWRGWGVSPVHDGGTP